MNYIKITTAEVTQGPGLRVCLWVSGCSHGCIGCHNPETWNPAVGKPFNNETIFAIKKQLEQPWCAGLTISGGDPLYPDNRSVISQTVLYFKCHCPDKSIWMWTGYIWPEIVDDDFCREWILPYIDILVDGSFIQAERDITLEWRGSANQRIIDVQKTLRHYNDKTIPYHKLYLWKNGEYR